MLDAESRSGGDGGFVAENKGSGVGEEETLVVKGRLRMDGCGSRLEKL